MFKGETILLENKLANQNNEGNKKLIKNQNCFFDSGIEEQPKIFVRKNR
jgi:hypothetical protein